MTKLDSDSGSQLAEDKRFLVKGSLIQLAGSSTKVISPFLVLLLARAYPQKEYGLYVSIQLLILTLSKLLTLGLDRGLVRQVAQQYNGQKFGARGVRAGLRITLWFSIAVTSISIALISFTSLGQADFMQGVSPLFVSICLVSLIPYSALQIISGALEGARLPQYRILLVHVLAFSLGPLLSILIHVLGVELISLAIGFTLGNLIAFVLGLWILNRTLPAPQQDTTWPNKTDIQYSLPIAGHESVAPILARTDLWMLLIMVGPEASAVYAIMSMLTNGLRSIRQGFDPILQTVVGSQKGEQGISRLPQIFTYTAMIVNAIQIPVAWTIICLPGEFLSLAGKEYIIEESALGMLMAGQMILGILVLFGQALIGAGHSTPPFKGALYTLFFNIGLSYLLIPKWGLWGAATATTISMILQHGGLMLYCYLKMGWKLIRAELLPQLFVTVVLVILILLFQEDLLALSLQNRIGLVIAGLVLWGALMWRQRQYLGQKVT